MKKYIYLLFTLVLVVSCNKNTDKEKFMSAYKDVLIIRLMYPDSAMANKKVNAKLQSMGFDKISFAAQFEKYSKDGPEFRKMMDTVRVRARREYGKIRAKEEME